MAGSLLLPLVRGVASKAASALVQTVTRMCGLDDDRDTLELHLLAVERKLASAEMRSQADLAVKRWMKKLRAVAYEADDVLDEFEYEALRRKYQIGESKKRKVLSYVTHHSSLLFRFAFCAVFPQDYVMDKDKLIQLWIANGFIQEEGTMDLAQKGELIFHNLVWRSFLQDLHVHRYNFFGIRTRIYESITCKMHDLMHDLAKDVTDECASIEELNQQKALLKYVCHIQTSKAELKQIRGLFKGKTHLRTLLAFQEYQT